MNNSRPLASSTTAGSSPQPLSLPNASSNSQRPSKPIDERHRSRFEDFLSKDACKTEDKDDDVSESASAWGLTGADGQALRPLATDSDSRGDGGGGPFAGDGNALPQRELVPAPQATVLDIQVPAPVFNNAAMSQQAHLLFAHMALPLNAGSDAGRFQVLDASSMVSHIEVNTLPQGGLTVAVGASVQNASLMDRYLPQLQRRLPDKVSAHMRVQESDAERD